MINYLLRLIKIALVVTVGVGGGIGLLVFVIVTAGHLTGKGDQHAIQYGLMAGMVIGLIVTTLFFCVMMPLDLLFRWTSERTNVGWFQKTGPLRLSASLTQYSWCQERA